MTVRTLSLWLGQRRSREVENHTGPRRERPGPLPPAGRLSLAHVLSLAIHLGVAWSIVASVTCEPEKLGSVALDIDLVQPRLAPPLAAQAALGQDDHARDRAPGPPHAAQAARRAKKARRASKAKVAESVPAARDGTMLARADEDTADADAPVEANPLSLLASVKREIAAKRDRVARHREQVKRQRAHHARRWKRFVASTTPSAGSTSGRGLGDRRARQAARYGLKFFLSGRQLKTSKVVHPPELIAFAQTTCRVPNPMVKPATVRTLIALDGSVGLTYIRHSSSSKRFDRCALRQVRGMRFKPGTDLAHKPLDVWLHIRVRPGLPHLL